MSDELTIEWRDDWDVGSHFEFNGEAYTDECGEPLEPDTCEVCIVRDSNGNVLASLGCIDGADNAYRLEVETELLEEARYELESPKWESTNVLCDY